MSCTRRTMTTTSRGRRQEGRPGLEAASEAVRSWALLSLPTNAWSHLAASYDGAMLRLFVNGTQVASRAQSGAIATSNAALTIGGDALYGQFFQGAIDEVRIYNVALTQAQIQADIATPIGNQQPDPTPPAVSITSPTSGSTVSQVPTVAATASDNVGVANVQFLADGASLGTDFNAPYVVPWNTAPVAERISHAHRRCPRCGRQPDDVVGNHRLDAQPGIRERGRCPQTSQDATTIAFLPDGRMLIGELSRKDPASSSRALLNRIPTPFLQLDRQASCSAEQGPDGHPAGQELRHKTASTTSSTRKGGAGQRQPQPRLPLHCERATERSPDSELLLWEDDVDAGGEHHGGSARARGADGKLYVTLRRSGLPEHSWPSDLH